MQVATRASIATTQRRSAVAVTSPGREAFHTLRQRECQLKALGLAHSGQTGPETIRFATRRVERR
jgi:hypothetical protein